MTAAGTDHAMREPDGARVAVIAVHGVADQEANETARSLADLLLRVQHDADGPVQYDHFVENSLRMDVRRLAHLLEGEHERVAKAPPAAARRAIFGSQFAAHLERGGQATQGKAAATPIDLRFTTAEIAQYEAALDPASYESLCLSAERIGKGARARTRVDVYEMYWADLSRLGRGLLRIFGELYQLFFHLRGCEFFTSAVGWARPDDGRPAGPNSA